MLQSVDVLFLYNFNFLLEGCPVYKKIEPNLRMTRNEASGCYPDSFILGTVKQ